MLRTQIKNQVQKQLRLLEAQLQLDTKIKQSINKGNACINDLISSLRNDPERLRKIFQQLSNKIGPQILEMERSAKLLEETEQELKFRREQLKKQKTQAQTQNQSILLSIEQIKQTIQKIQSAVQQTVQTEQTKRLTMQQQTQISLKEVQNKISLFEKETVLFEKQNLSMKKKKKQIDQKFGRLEVEFKKKAEQKDENVKKEKEDLMLKLQSLEGEVSQVTELNKEYSTREKSNFDKKLSLYLKAKKFPEYSTSFENSAKTIDQCKQQLFKGIQRMNEAGDTIARFEIEAKELCDCFTAEFKKRDEREGRIESLKKEKEVMRDRIISIQNKIKSMKVTVEDNVG